MSAKTADGTSYNVELLGPGGDVRDDGAITPGLHIAASEGGSVDLMNKEAKRLGINNTHFTNPVGMPDAQHYSSAADLALLAAAIVRDYPQHYPLFALRD